MHLHTVQSIFLLLISIFSFAVGLIGLLLIIVVLFGFNNNNTTTNTGNTIIDLDDDK